MAITNPIKIYFAVSKSFQKATTSARKIAPPSGVRNKKSIITNSAGRKKAAGKVGNTPMPKGSNKKTAKQSLMTSPTKEWYQKHPLVRNAGQSSAVGKYQINRRGQAIAKPIPTKKKAK